MFCPNCGTEATEEAHFCYSCGKPLPSIEQSTASTLDYPQNPEGPPKSTVRDTQAAVDEEAARERRVITIHSGDQHLTLLVDEIVFMTWSGYSEPAQRIGRIAAGSMAFAVFLFGVTFGVGLANRGGTFLIAESALLAATIMIAALVVLSRRVVAVGTTSGNVIAIQFSWFNFNKLVSEYKQALGDCPHLHDLRPLGLVRQVRHTVRVDKIADILETDVFRAWLVFGFSVVLWIQIAMGLMKLPTFQGKHEGSTGSLILLGVALLGTATPFILLFLSRQLTQKAHDSHEEIGPLRGLVAALLAKRGCEIRFLGGASRFFPMRLSDITDLTSRVRGQAQVPD